MQDNNIIYEISRKIQDKNNLKNDFEEALSLVKGLFKEKYIDKIESEFKNKLNHINENPSKEIHLLNSLKPFFEEPFHEKIDKTINLISTMSAISSFKTSLKPNKINNNQKISINSLNKNLNIDPSVKEDGVYDIDENCLLHTTSNSLNQNNFLMLILFLFIFTGKY